MDQKQPSPQSLPSKWILPEDIAPSFFRLATHLNSRIGLIGSLAYMAWIPFDYLFAPSFFWEFLPIRLLAGLSILQLRIPQKAVARNQNMTLLQSLISQIGIAFMLGRVPTDTVGPYLGGFLLANFTIGTLFLWTPLRFSTFVLGTALSQVLLVGFLRGFHAELLSITIVNFTSLALISFFMWVNYRRVVRDLRYEQDIMNQKILLQEHTKRLEEQALALIASHAREQEQSKHLLMKSEKLSQIGTMVACIGHEINTPCNWIKLSASEAASHILDLEQQLEQQTVKHPETKDREMQLNLIQDLKDRIDDILLGEKKLEELSSALRIQSRDEQEITEGVEIPRLIQECLTLIKGRIKVFKTETQIQELPLIDCYRSQIGQVLTNLLANAADALATKGQKMAGHGGPKFIGRIRVEAYPKDFDGRSGVLLAVSDNGDGVPEALRRKIFDEFFTTKAAGAGTGLGLSLSLSIVKEHQGHLEVSQDTQWGGARFELWLPLQPQASLTRPREAS